MTEPSPRRLGVVARERHQALDGLLDQVRRAAEERGIEVSFERAIATMTTNLDTEIKEFGKRVKQDQSVAIAYSENYRGSSASFALLLALALAVGLAPQRTRRKRPAG